MSFNFGGFLNGMSQSIVKSIEEEEEQQRRFDYLAETEAMKLRSARKAERDKKNRITEELMGALSVFYDDDTARKLAKKGATAAEIYLDIGQRAIKKDIDPMTVLNLPSVSGDLNENDQNTINSTINAASPAKVGDITTTETTLTQDNDSILSGFGINPTVYKDLYAEPDKIENSFGTRLAVIGQEIARDPDGSVMGKDKYDALIAEEQTLLKRLATYEDAKRDKTGEDGEAFGAKNVPSQIKGVYARLLSPYGFKLGINNEIENMKDGQQHFASMAAIGAAKELTTRNADIKSTALSAAIRGMYDTANDQLAEYAFEKYNADMENKNNPPKDKDGKLLPLIPQVIVEKNENDFARNVQQRKYKVGSVITDGTFLYVYHGYQDPFAKDNRFSAYLIR